MMKQWVRRWISLGIHLIIVSIVTFVLASKIQESGWMMRDRYGLSSLRLFTTLSNLLQGLASALYLLSIVGSELEGRKSIFGAVRFVKYAAAVSVTLTFLTVLLYIGPTSHDMADALFHGDNRYFHFLIPILAIVDQCVFDREGVLRRIDSLFATIPVIAYGIFYWINIAVNGVGDGVYSNDWYGFLKAGYIFAPVIYAAFVLIAWGIALVFRIPRRSHRIKGMVN